MQVEMEVPRFNHAHSASFFQGFACRSLTVGETIVGAAFRERPLAAAVGIHQ
jgi:hypothetical protein